MRSYSNKTVIEVIVEVLISLIRRGLKGSLIFLAALNFVACKEKGASGEAEFALVPSPGGVVSSPVTLALKSGAGFSCFELPGVVSGEVIYCFGSNTALSLGSTQPIAYAASSSGFPEFEVWDDSFCVTSSVSLRPYSRLPGSALYCFGEASLRYNYVAYDLIYGGPIFSSASHGSPEVSFAFDPFVGGDEPMDLMTEVLGGWLVMGDSRSSVSSSSLSCSRNGNTLTCPSFTLNLQ